VSAFYQGSYWMCIRKQAAGLTASTLHRHLATYIKFIQLSATQFTANYNVRSPAGTTAGNIFYLVATR